MGKWEDKYEEETSTWSDLGDLLKFWEQDEDHISVGDAEGEIEALKKIPKDERTKKDYYDTFGTLNKFKTQSHGIKDWPIIGVDIDKLFAKEQAIMRDEMDELFPDRGKGTQFDQFTKAYAIKDEDKRKKAIERLRKQISPDTRGPHIESGRPFVESDVTEAILRGNLKKPAPPYEGPFGKLGEYFSKNAAARDKMFQYLGSMGREMVKPIEPGQAAAGALVPTLSRGFEKGETEYAAKQAAATKRMLDMASAQQKINPLQYFSNKMKEAKAMVPQGIEPGSAAEKQWIANYLRSTGIPTQLVDLTASVESLNLQLMQARTEEEKKRLQTMIDGINNQILDLASKGMGGTTGTHIPYMP